jgi:hypothetical protein
MIGPSCIYSIRPILRGFVHPLEEFRYELMRRGMKVLYSIFVPAGTWKPENAPKDWVLEGNESDSVMKVDVMKAHAGKVKGEGKVVLFCQALKKNKTFHVPFSTLELYANRKYRVTKQVSVLRKGTHSTFNVCLVCQIPISDLKRWFKIELCRSEHYQWVKRSKVPAVVKNLKSEILTPGSKQQLQRKQIATPCKDLPDAVRQAAKDNSSLKKCSQAGMIVLIRIGLLFEKCLRCPQAVSTAQGQFSLSELAFLLSYMANSGMDLEEQGNTTIITTDNVKVAVDALRTPGAPSWLRTAKFTAPHLDPRTMHEKTLPYYASQYLSPGAHARWQLNGPCPVDQRNLLFQHTFGLPSGELPVSVQSTTWVANKGTAATITAVESALTAMVTVKVKKVKIVRKYRNCMGEGNEFWDSKFKVTGTGGGKANTNKKRKHAM